MNGPVKDDAGCRKTGNCWFLIPLALGVPRGEVCDLNGLGVEQDGEISLGVEKGVGVLGVRQQRENRARSRAKNVSVLQKERLLY